MSNGEIRISKLTLWKAVSGILFILLLVSIFTNGFGILGEKAPAKPTESAKPAEQAKPAEPAPKKIDLAELDLEGVHFLGEEDAPVTIIIYDDFQCPFCKRWEDQTWPQLKEEYIDTGKAKFYFKHFPLGFHPNAKPASMATECAGDQDKFWEMHDIIFENQETLSIEKLKEWAEEIELDIPTFNECFGDSKYEERISADMKEGQGIGVRGTPSFVIDDELVVGAQPFEKFKQVIDAKLD